MIRKVLPINKFPHRTFAVVAIIALVAFLLTIKPVAEVVKKGVESLGISFPPMDVFRNASANILLVAAGYMVLAIGSIVAIPILKVAVVVAGLAIAGVGIYNLYRTFMGGSTTNILPDNTPLPPKG
jgi:hypothetical protein